MMENKESDLGKYLTAGVEKIVKGAVRATLADPRESAFMARFALSSREASRRRAKAEEGGRARVFPYKFSRRCGAMSVFAIFRHKCEKHLTQSGAALAVVHCPA